ncbi:sigma-E processing peptidase SpoIIGA [Jeotgalibacillus soli]|uniref:Sporulation sigma-E factor-processing peptidase n=1 Tax=Jeotgalibacillus soli TaxID=889306 RepID=A0A0C2VLC4_9BACL|nr:sigma-E processing peptidase SpoIIGA [Jeotgalibacillus soli]KIL44803.1 hypothetical protein KP78_23470 [Jeotgalibacillus soli]
MLHLEALWALNVWIDSCLLWVTGRFIHQSPNWERFLIATTLSTFLQAVVIFFQLSNGFALMMGFLSSLLVVTLSFSLRSFKEILRSFYVLYSFACLLGGGIMMTAQFSIPPFLYKYVSDSLIMLGFVALVLIVILMGSSHFISAFRLKHIQQTFTYQVSIEVDGQAWEGFGFLDSGNHLVDPFTQAPVMLASSHVARNLLPQEVINIKDSSSFDLSSVPVKWQRRIRMIPSRSIHSSNKIMIGIVCDSVQWSIEGKKYRVRNIPVIFTDQSLLFENDCSCLLNPLQFQQCQQL